MAHVIAESVVVEFPIYGKSNSVRSALMAKAGGMIRREGAQQSRVTVRALDGISFELCHGDKVGLVGHNGAGKSSLLRVLAGVYSPIGGKLFIDGGITSLLNNVAGLSPESSGYENIVTCGMFLGMTKKDIEKKLPEIAEFTELGDYLNLPVRTYSSGMALRLGFAVATALDPEILLLDENIGAGDAAFADKARQRMQRLVNKSSIIVLASHSNAVIRSMCNKAMWLDKGRIVRFGGAEEVLQAYEATQTRRN